MRTFTYQRWSGGRKTVEADKVTFEPSGHVAFWKLSISQYGIEREPILVLAERTEQVNELKEES